MTIRTRILAVFAAAALTVPALSACGTYHDTCDPTPATVTTEATGPACADPR